MTPRNLRPDRGGFTLIEATISTAILAVALFTSLSISDAATKASNRSVAAASREAAVLRHLERLRRVVTRAAASTLLATPASSDDANGSPDPMPEPMLDGVDYENVSFREPVGFADGATVFEPPLHEEPRRIELVRDERTGIGTLVLADGERLFELARDVIDVSFARAGDEITIELTTTGSVERTSDPATSRIRVALHAR